jgi:hypothetical protein
MWKSRLEPTLQEGVSRGGQKCGRYGGGRNASRYDPGVRKQPLGCPSDFSRWVVRGRRFKTHGENLLSRAPPVRGEIDRKARSVSCVALRPIRKSRRKSQYDNGNNSEHPWGRPTYKGRVIGIRPKQRGHQFPDDGRSRPYGCRLHWRGRWPLLASKRANRRFAPSPSTGRA